MNKPSDFNELVTWATWQVIEGITKGTPVRDVVSCVLQRAFEIMSDIKTNRP